VDLNSIPPAAVERIEILKDGASAIYGSDAIAGVVNVIMKRDFHGVLTEAFYGETQEGDLDTRNLILQYGTGLPDGSFFITATHYEQGAIFARDRQVSRSADTRFLGGTDQRSSATPDARIVLPDDATVIADGAGYRPVTEDDLFDYQAFTTAVVPMTRSSLYTNASYDFSEQITGYLDFSYLVTDSEAILAPTPVFTAFEAVPLPVAADQAYNAFGVTLEDVRRRLLELPPRTQRNESEVTRFSAITEGLFSDWHWDIGFTWSRSEAEETTANIVNADRLRRALGPAAGCRGPAIDGCTPVNLTGPQGSITAEQADYIRTLGRVSGYSKLASGSVNLTRGIDILPAGRLDLALGLEVRHESTSKRPSRLLAEAGTIGATNFEATRGDRNATEVYVEGLIPVWKSASGLSHFDVEAAVRFSNYNDFNDSTNPKLALRWQVGPDLLLRASFAEGFRAPSLNELYAGVTESQDFLEDPCTRPENVGVLPGCTQLADPTRNQFLTLKGGNAGLRAETSDSYSAGLVWTPGTVAGLALSVDYFLIEQRDVVSSSAQFVLSQNARDGSFANRVQRDEAGNLTLVEATNINVGERRVSGVDLALTYHYPDRRWGQFSLVGSATYIDEYETRVDPDAPLLDLAGTFRDEASEGLGGIPEWKAQLGLRWNRERWRGNYQIHYIGTMDERVPDGSRTRTIDAWMVHDLQLSYKLDVLEGLRLTLGLDNVFDRDAPLAASAFNDNIDGRTHELRGRYWYTKVSQRF
jgi:iron complex outermembrane receptor protein